MTTKAEVAAVEREWRKATDDSAYTILQRALDVASAGGGLLLADSLGDRPTVEIRGPDGEWRRYYVRLTEVRP